MLSGLIIFPFSIDDRIFHILRSIVLGFPDLLVFFDFSYCELDFSYSWRGFMLLGLCRFPIFN